MKVNLRLVAAVLILFAASGCAPAVRPIVQEADPFLGAVTDVARSMETATKGLHPSCDRAGSVDACIQASREYVEAAKVSAQGIQLFVNDPENGVDARALSQSLKRLAEAMRERTESLIRRDARLWVTTQQELDSAATEYAEVLAVINTNQQS